ncbi:MAG: hypothetical protein ACI4JA_06580 [Oscillospiraceae bacterium]
MKTHLKFVGSVLCLSLLLLTACADTPENVKNNSQNTISDDREFMVTELSEINEKKSEYIDALKKLRLDNITFSDNFEVSVPQKIKTGEFICPTGFQDNYKQIFAHYDDDFKEENAIDDGNTYPTGPTYINAEKGLELSIGCTGFFSYSKNFDPQKCYYESEAVRSFSRCEVQENTEKYKLINSAEEISLSEAMSYAQGFADDFTDMCDYPNKLYPARISLYKCTDGYFYRVEYTQSVSGVNILEYGSQYGEAYENTVVSGSFAYICGNEVNSFVINSYFDEYKIADEITSVCDPVDAAQYLSEALAGKMELETKRIALEYCMIMTGNIQESSNGEETDREKAPWAACCSYDVYKAVPCWVFYFDETDNKEVYAMVSCDDMSVYFINNQKGS